MLWKSFFAELGFDVVVSPPTNKEILEWGLTTCVDGACLPIKSYVGHSLFLAEQGVPLLFVPQVISVSRKEYTCPNVLGLPDLLRQYLPASVDMVSPVLDARKNEGSLARSYHHLGRKFACRGLVRSAWKKSVQAQLAWEQSGWYASPNSGGLKVLIVGPRYLTDDPFLNGNLHGHLKRLGVQVLTASEVPHERSLSLSKGVEKRLFWLSARQSMGALEHLIDTLDGVVILAPFGCGAESFVAALIERRVRDQRLASLALNVDEHTSALGMITRLEAFCDLLERKKSG